MMCEIRSDQERARAANGATRQALGGAQTAGWGESSGPSRRERARLGWGVKAGWWAVAAAACLFGCAGAAAGIWEQDGWRVALSVAAAAWASLAAGCAVGVGVGELARGGGAVLAIRWGARMGLMFAKISVALMISAPALALEEFCVRAGFWSWPLRFPRFAQTMREGRELAREGMRTGWFARPMSWAEAGAQSWEAHVQDQVERLGPLAAWGLASQRARWGDKEGAAKAWALAPFDPGWELELGGGKGKKAEVISFVELCRRGAGLEFELDWRALESALESEALRRQTERAPKTEGSGAQSQSRLGRAL